MMTVVADFKSSGNLDEHWRRYNDHQPTARGVRAQLVPEKVQGTEQVGLWEARGRVALALALEMVQVAEPEALAREVRAEVASAALVTLAHSEASSSRFGFLFRTLRSGRALCPLQ